ncbi:MAG: PAS domain S-box protein [Betaproteobacteria bacterium]|nr:MAG: PAS domain S-box protein [Betaproteobacteria bacterium]
MVKVREGNGRLANFDAVGRQLLPYFPGVSSVSLAPGGVIRDVVPLAGNENAIGQDLLNNAATKREASLALRTGALTLAGPFVLVQGETAAIGRLPVFLEDAAGAPSFWGFVNVVIRFPDALESAGLPQLRSNEYAYRLWRVDPETRQELTIASSTTGDLKTPVESLLHVPNGTWTLSVAPVGGWSDRVGLSLDVARGLLLSLLLAYLAKLLVELRLHRRELEALVAERTADVKAREDDLKRAQEIARVGSWVLDLSTTELHWSEVTYRIFGVAPDTPLNYAALLERIHPADREAVDRAWKAALKGARYDIEHRILVGEAIRWVHEQADPEFARDGTPIRCVGTVQDVTERRLAENALRAAEEQFRGLVEQSIAGAYIIQDDRFVYVNPRFAEIFGYASADEIVGLEVMSLVAPQHRDGVADRIRRRIDGNLVTVNYEFTALRKDGATTEVGVHGARATHRGHPAIIGLVQDISEKKRAEERIREYVARLEGAFMRTVEVATTLSEMRDPYTAGHERRVAEIAVAIGNELGFDAQRLEGLRVAGYLHDIGKITVPAEILAKPGKLNAIEYQLIQLHAQAGYDVLKDVGFPWPVAEAALQHHERLDGSGYPNGLKGDAIGLEARILAVADTVEAMASHRPYRPGLGIDKALAEIERGRGSAFDPVVADSCLRLFREKNYRIPD